jgi:hypothetical protein
MTKAEKALKLVKEGRVHVGWISKETNGEERPIAADGTVDGYTTDGTYRTSYSPFGAICTCPAGLHHRRCSHSLALEIQAAHDALQLELML